MSPRDPRERLFVFAGGRRQEQTHQSGHVNKGNNIHSRCVVSHYLNQWKNRSDGEGGSVAFEASTSLSVRILAISS